MSKGQHSTYMDERVSKLWQMAMTELQRANVDKKHPFRYMVLATHGQFPECRWIVNRRFSEKHSLLFYTDSRTPKTAQISANPRVAITWYHPKKKLQIRMKGTAELLTSGAEFDKHYKIVSQHPDDYNTLLAPGSLNPTNIQRSPEINLAVVSVEAFIFDILLLDRAGHQRAYFERQDNKWNGKNVTP